MIKLIQTHFKKKQIQARAMLPKQVVNVNQADIKRKLQDYKPTVSTPANFSGPRISEQDLENVV